MLNKFSKEQPQSFYSMNLTSVTDVLLTLLILFMLIAAAGEEKSLSMGLPKEKGVNVDKKTVLYISFEGGQLLELKTPAGKKISVTQNGFGFLLSTMQEIKKINTAVIKADEKQPYKEVIYVIDQVKNAGITDISLSGQKSHDKNQKK